MTKQKYFPIKEYPSPPHEASAGYEWHKFEKYVEVEVARRVYETAYEALWVKGSRRPKRRGHYRYVKYRLFTGRYRRVTAHYRIKYWTQVKTGKVPEKENWTSAERYLIYLEDSIRKQYGRKIKITSQSIRTMPDGRKKFRHAEIYKSRKRGLAKHLELNTLFNSFDPKLEPQKLFSVAIVYYYIKITGYAGTHIERIKSTFGQFDRPMNVYDLSEYVRNTVIEDVKKRLKKSSHLSFVRYAYFGAMTDEEQLMAKIRRKEREKRIRQFKKMKKQRIRLNPRGL